MRAPAHSATSRQRLSPGLTLPELRHLSKTLALALAGSVSSTPHPNPLLRWHSWQMVGRQTLLRDTCIQIVHFHVLLRKQPQSDACTSPYNCKHNANLVATPSRSLILSLQPPSFIPFLKRSILNCLSLPPAQSPSSLRDRLTLGFSCFS